jgi:hypothetical protein
VQQILYLNNYLQDIQEIKSLSSSGSSQGTIISIKIDEPVRLLSMLTLIPGAEVGQETLDPGKLGAMHLPQSLQSAGKIVRFIKIQINEG